MKLQFDVEGKTQPDPYIFDDGDRLYLFVTADEGVEAYSSDRIDGVWHFEGIVCRLPDARQYWAPCVCKTGGKYYLYFSCQRPEKNEFLHVASADRPLGPYKNAKCLYDRFTIDAHVVETPAGLFLFYAENNTDDTRIGTRVFVDRLLDPYTPAALRREVIRPSFDEEIYQRARFEDGRDWHTIEGPFYLRVGNWHYLMYSGGCYQNDTYHIGYTVAKSAEDDLTRVDFVKHTADGRFDPLMIRNEREEGTGHHSVLRTKDGDLYMVYHARDYGAPAGEARTARYCRLTVNGEQMTAGETGSGF